MKDIRKINETSRFEYNERVGASDVYRKFKIPFDALFNADEIAKSKQEFEKIYVNDGNFEEKLEQFRNSVGSMAAFCVGYTGIGKTTSLRYCFNLGVKNIPVYNADRKELVFPAFFDGHNLELNYSEDLAKKIGSVCTFLEKENKDLKRYMRSDKGLEEFLEFVQETKPEIVEVDPMMLLNMPEKEEIRYRLKYAFENHMYSYYAIRLKFMIAQKYDKYERLIIILDDVESLPHDYQQNLIRLYLSFFDCMNNTKFPEKSEYNINLLISLRPHTYRLFNNNRNLETYPIQGNPITKDEPIDLAKMFKKRFDYYQEISPRVIGNLITWQECYKELDNMNNLFKGQYKLMIIRLCFMNIREALSYYAKVFANRFWVQRNKEIYPEFTVNASEYEFNNITVIRALACNESKVYFNEENNIFPCLFPTTKHKDNSIVSLLLLFLFYKRKEANEYYGIGAKSKKSIMKELESVFPDTVVKDFEECLFYLFEKRILRKSILDKDDIKTLDKRESLKDESKLYLSSKGEEMWRMLAQDSVLLELFREEVYRNYTDYQFSDQPSFELEQEKIFMDLLQYIEYLSYLEDDLRNAVVGKVKKEKYKEMFGEMMIVTHLLGGVECSLRYSGKMENEIIKNRFMELQRHLKI